MDIESFEERYRGMSTDELLNVYVSSDLVEPASMAIKAELERRGITSHEISEAKSYHEYVITTQDRPTKRSTKIIVNVLGVLGATTVLIIILMLKRKIFS